MKKILFIPTYTYLSSPIFTRLLSVLDEFKTIYLDIEDQFDSQYTSEKFKGLFDKSITLHLSKKFAFLGFFGKIIDTVIFKQHLIHLIAKEAPDIILTTSDMTLSIRIIKQSYPQIPIVIIQPALIQPALSLSRKEQFKHNIKYFFFNKLLKTPIVRRQRIYGLEYEDTYLLVWGKYFKNMLRREKNVYIIGDITLDNYPIRRQRSLKKEYLKRYGLSEDCPIILICTGAFKGLIDKNIERELYTNYIEWIQDRHDLFFMVKPHPREKNNLLTAFIAEKKPKNAQISEELLPKSFQYIDIHVSSFSRTSIEALASRIPTISFNPNNQVQLNNFFSRVLDITVSNIVELNGRVDIYLNDQKIFFIHKEKDIENLLYRLDGNAAMRAKRVIKQEILGEKR